MIASDANLAPVSEMARKVARKLRQREEIEFLTCRTSYNNCDTKNSGKRVN